MKIKGQFQLTRLSVEDTIKMNLFFSIRRCHYDLALLQEHMTLSPEDNTLFGEYGENGEFLIPSIRHACKLQKFAPYLATSTRSDDTILFEMEIENALRSTGDLDCFKGYSSNISGQLYYDFQVFSPEGDDHSYLVWAGGDKSWLTSKTMPYINSLLQRVANASILAGAMAMYDYDLVSLAYVKDGQLHYAEQRRYEEKPEDFIIYKPELAPALRPFVVRLCLEATRNIEYFTGNEDGLNNEDTLYDDSLWELDENLSVYLGTYQALDADEAKKMAAEDHDIDISLMMAQEV